MSRTRSIKSYDRGGIELWNLQVKETAQKAWTFERYLHSLKSTSTTHRVSFAHLWCQDNRIKHKCKEAWLKLYKKPEFRISTPDTQLPTAYTSTPKLKTIYHDILNITQPKWNEEARTVTQHELATKLNSQLPFARTRTLVPIKGRDLLWRYLLKAIPKIHHDDCPFCDEFETSQHIFFTCKSINKDITTIINQIFLEFQITHQAWDEMIFNKLNSNIIGNVTAIAFEEIWYRRNQKRHHRYTYNLTADNFIKKLKVVQGAIWSKEIKRINSIIIKTLGTHKNQQQSNNIKITKRLRKFHNEWNSNLTKIIIPQHLKQYL